LQATLQGITMLCTSNLAGNFWSPVSTNIPGTDGTVRVIDTNAATQPRRFYRVQASR